MASDYYARKSPVSASDIYKIFRQHIESEGAIARESLLDSSEIEAALQRMAQSDPGVDSEKELINILAQQRTECALWRYPSFFKKSVAELRSRMQETKVRPIRLFNGDRQVAVERVLAEMRCIFDSTNTITVGWWGSEDEFAIGSECRRVTKFCKSWFKSPFISIDSGPVNAPKLDLNFFDPKLKLLLSPDSICDILTDNMQNAHPVLAVPFYVETPATSVSCISEWNSRAVELGVVSFNEFAGKTRSRHIPYFGSEYFETGVLVELQNGHFAKCECL